MKVLIVNTHDLAGGAARAAYRLHQGLQSIGIESQMLVQFKTTDDYTVSGPAGMLGKGWAKIRQTIERLPLRRYPERQPVMFSPAWVPFSGLAERINHLDADIVHLHWIVDGMLKMEDLASIKKPVVWTLHDNWAFTGGCHVKWDCQKYTASCGSCPRLGSVLEDDLSRKGWERKGRVYAKMPDMTIIGLSQCIADEARCSSLLQHHKVVNLPNPIDTGIYKPLDRQVAREMFNLPQNKKLVMFGAMQATSDTNKGYKYLLDSLRLINDKNIELVVFGSSQPQEPESFGFVVHYIGRLHDDVSLRALYSAADVMVVPSLQENLSNAIMESLACGTPVVAFDTGGNVDLIDHLQNGYLATAFEPESLARGIEWVINYPEPGLLAKAAREKVEKCFAMDKVARQYEAVYQELLGENAQGS